MVLRESERMLSRDMDAVGPKNASRIWGFISKFVMLDRFIKTLGLADLYPGIPIHRYHCDTEYLGTASRVMIFLTIYPTFLSCLADS